MLRWAGRGTKPTGRHQASGRVERDRLSAVGGLLGGSGMGAAGREGSWAIGKRSCGQREEKGPRRGEDLYTHHLCPHQCQGLGRWYCWAEQEEGA